MNKKVKYIIFIISVLIFILGCKNNATNPSTFEELGKYRGTWVADNVYMLDLSSDQFLQSGNGMTIKINSDTDTVIDNIVPISIRHLPDTVDSYYLYISTDDVPPPYLSIIAMQGGQVNGAYYKLEFTSHNSLKIYMILQARAGLNPFNLVIQKAELKKTN
ncbi:hypothetical protein [Brachyspira intermedia]|uniref:hypothetical protein n=1 Tax=Brachyspira intermedia TaxID=84377 RepID=UPI00300661C9